MSISTDSIINFGMELYRDNVKFGMELKYNNKMAGNRSDGVQKICVHVAMHAQLSNLPIKIPHDFLS